MQATSVAAGRIERLRFQTDKALEAHRDIAGNSEQPQRLAKRGAVDPQQLIADRAIFGGIGEIRQRRAIPVIRLAVLMHQPDDLARVARRIRGTWCR